MSPGSADQQSTLSFVPLVAIPCSAGGCVLSRGSARSRALLPGLDPRVRGHRLGLSVAAWGPLAGGVLSGRVSSPAPRPGCTARLASSWTASEGLRATLPR